MNQIFSKYNYIFSKSNMYNYSIQTLTILVNLMLVPLLLSSLGKTSFGIWQTILSIIGYTSLLNFGMGNGLRNTISKYFVNNNFDAIGNLTGQTIIKLLYIISVFSVFFFSWYYLYFDSSSFFKGISNIKVEVNEALGIYFLFFLMNIIASLVSSIAFGINKSYLPGFVNLIYLVLVYVIIYVVRIFTNYNLVHTAIIFGFLQVFSNILFFYFLLKKHSIKLSFNKKYDLKETSKLSLDFFIVQLLSIVFLSSDNLIVSNLLGADKTAEFSIVSKIYFTLISFYSILLISFWNGVSVAFFEKKMNWIIKNIKVLFFISFLILLIGLIISFFNNEIINLWFGKNVFYFTKNTFYLFSVFTFFHCFNAVLINFQNGIGDMKIQILSTSLMIIIYFSGAYLMNTNNYGYNGLIVIKICAVFIGILINLLSLKKLNEAYSS